MIHQNHSGRLLDYNCFQRGFDDPLQIRIQLEALACQEIFTKAEMGDLLLFWSFMHEDETILCPFPERKYEALRLADLCKTRIGPDSEIRQLAVTYQNRASLPAKDAIHVACAVHCRASHFLTCDDRLAHRANRLNLDLVILNPTDYIRKETSDGEDD